MILISKKIKTGFLLMVTSMAILSSCNKEVEQFPLNVTTIPSGLSLAETVAATPNDSLFNKIIKKNAAIVTLLTSKSSSFTLFVPDNAAVIASFGGTLAAANAVITAMSVTTATLIVSYNIIPQALPTSKIVHPFPNMQMPTAIILDPTNPLVRMTSFPSKNPANNIYYYNNAPLVSTDIIVANGIIHHTAFLVAPPSQVLKSLIAADANLSYFRAAIARADSGKAGLNRFDSLLNYAVTNMTVLAPNNTAFQTVLDTTIRRALIAQGLPPATAAATATFLASSDTVFRNPALYSSLTAATVRGIIAYHFLSAPVNNVYTPNIRVFTVNVPPTPTFIKTLVNSSFAPHPGVMAQATYAGPFVTALTFAGVGTNPTGGAPFSQPANAVVRDRLAVNGITHTIDKVLLPQ